MSDTLSPGSRGAQGSPGPNASPERVAIAGAGLAGSLLAAAFAERGFAVEVYERRDDPRLRLGAEGRSINLGLSKRGLAALAMVGMKEQILGRAVAMRGRVIHSLEGGTSFQAYGIRGEEVLHSVDRNELNRALIDRAEARGARFHFRHRCLALDKEARALAVADEAGGRTLTVATELLIGADGAFSRMRQEMQRGERADYSQEFLEWGYKELTVPARADGSSAIELEALHVWPRGHCLIVTHPNRDGSHTATLFLPFEGRDSFADIRSEGEVADFFRRYFPDLPALVPDYLEQWQQHPEGTLVTTRTAPWTWRDWLVLVGDACHAVYPFYGQGMNSAFEDCTTLVACLDEHGGRRREALAEYQRRRKVHTDTLAELSKENFLELRQRVASPWFRARKRLDLLLSRLFPAGWLPLYTMISHTTIPYADALARARRQDRWLRWAAAGAAGIAALLLLARAF